jgi:hypothetical protein
MWTELLASRVQTEVDLAPGRARYALQTSLEHLPELWAIADMVDGYSWGHAVAISDTVQNLSRLIDWGRPGRIAVLRLPTMREFVEAL